MGEISQVIFIFQKDQNNEINNLVEVPTYCLGTHFVADVVAPTLLKTKSVSNMCPKMFIQAFKDIYPVQMHPCVHSHMYMHT